MGLLILMGVFALCVVIGLPVAFALGVAALSAFAFEGLPLIIAFQRIVSGISVFSLMEMFGKIAVDGKNFASGNERIFVRSSQSNFNALVIVA